MNWLITGGCGFIGSQLIAFLQQQPGAHAIRVIDNLSVGQHTDLGGAHEVSTYSATDLPNTPFPDPEGAIQLVIGDVQDRQLAQQAAQGTDVIVHLAGNTGVAPSLEDPQGDCHTNVLGTLNYLEAARNENVNRFVFASSGGTVIGDATPPIHEEMAPHPNSPYGASKLAGEGYCSAYYQSFGLESVALRFGNVYGPGSHRKQSVVATFIRRALAGETLEIYGDGKQSRDFIFVHDLARAIYQAATVPGIGGETFQIATSRETTVNEIAEALEQVLQEAGITELELNYAEPRPGEVRRNVADTNKAATQLGWQAEYTLRQGLQATYAWFLEREPLQAAPDLIVSSSL